jgi:sirohydrochlorin cobaltochelatase
VAIGLPQNVRGQEAPVFTHDALLLIGHGSTVLPGAARPLLAHAEVIRASRRFREVAVCMMLGEPDAASVVGALTSPVVHVVPCFLENGYFTRIAIPDLLLPFGSASRVIRFCQHIGSHGGIVEMIEDRLLRHCAMFGIDPKSLSVLLVGHGSSRNPGRARSLRRHVAVLESRGRFGWVRISYLEEAPSVADALSSARVHVVAAVGYLTNDGVHAARELPALIAAERDQRGTHWPPVHDLGSIGADEAMPRLIMDQVTPP